MTRPAARTLRRALVLLTATAVLVPAGPALAQTATSTPSATASPSATPTPTPPARPSVDVDRSLIDYGGTHSLLAFGREGERVQLWANTLPNRTPKVIREAVLGPFEGDAVGVANWDLRPGGTTTYYAVVDGVRSATTTVQVRRTATIGVRQAGGTYTFSGQVGRPQAGVQVTIARLDSQTRRVTGVASTRTTADGRYVIRTGLPLGLAGYYALTSATPDLLAGRSRLYGLLVNVRPAPPETISLDVGRGPGYHLFSGAVSPGRSVPVTLARIVGGRLVGVVGTRSAANGGYVVRVPLGPGTYFFQTVTATARSRVYGLVVPEVSRPADVDCADFTTQRAAQAFHDRWSPQFGDYADLDGDDDGQACDALP